MSSHDPFELRAGGWNIVVAPSLGGSLLSCEHDGFPVLRPTVQATRSGASTFDCCHFPLIPFSNRIKNASFVFKGKRIHLAPNIPGEPHALHGHGWQVWWCVVERNDASCTMSFRHAPSHDWPWAYEGRQSLSIHDNELRMTLAIENVGSDAMPCGLGFHPFLPATDDARLRMEAGRVWEAPVDAFPCQPIAVPAHLDFRDGPLVVERRGTNHCFDGWSGRAVVSYERSQRSLVLEGCATTQSVIAYIPDHANYFCVEPVTHAVNAVNLPNPLAGGWWTLPPNQTREIAMSIRCSNTT